MKLRQVLVSASLAALAIGIAPGAHAQSASVASSLTGFSYQLIDLDPNDGIAASLQMSLTQSWMVASDYLHPIGSPEVIDYGPGPGTKSVSTAFGQASGTTGADNVSASATSPWLEHRLYTNGFMSWNFVLSPNTSVIFTAIGNVDAKGASTEGTATLSGVASGGPIVEDEIDRSNGAETRQLSLSFSSSLTERSGVINISSDAHIMPVPEPETYAMLLAGLGLIGACRRRRGRGRGQV